MVVVEVIGAVRNKALIAAGPKIREVKRLRREYGPGRWLKMKGIATVRVMDLQIARAEIHWYEAHGIGKLKMKISRILECLRSDRLKRATQFASITEAI